MKRLIIPLLAFVAGCQGHPQPDSPTSGTAGVSSVTVPVVHTWSDLRRGPAIDLGRGVRVRLGVEADSSPSPGGVLLYALTEDYSESESAFVERDLGPLRVEYEGQERLKSISHKVLRKRSRELLFVKALVPRGGEPLRVRVITPDGRVVGQVHVTSLGRAHPFLSWAARGEFTQETSREPVWRVGAPHGFMAVPRWTEAVRPETNDLHALLPTLIPRTPDPTLVLTAWGKRLTLTSTDGDMDTGEPQQHVIARWWVNGAPLALPLAKQTEQLRRLRERRRGTTLQLEIDLDGFDVEPGDLVGVQLLYCESGWMETHRLQKLLAVRLSERPFPRLSNRVEFQVPPDH